MKANDDNVITMVDRAAKILRQLYLSEEPMGVSELARVLDLPKANVYRLLYTLEQNEMLEQEEETGKYKLGALFIIYGDKVKSKLSLKTISEPLMKKLAKETGESVNLGILYEGDVLTVHKEEGESSVLVSKLIPISPLYCSSMGKLFLAHMDEDQIRAYFDITKLERRTINTITQTDDFIKEREEILRSNLAYDREEYEYGLSCIAAPIEGEHGKIVSSISISGPTSRMEIKNTDKISKLLKDTADLISKKIKVLETY